MSDATLGSTIDNHVSDLEIALGDLLGIPINTNIAAALFEVVATGLNSIILQNAAADPSAAGIIRRNGGILRYHNSQLVGSIPLFIDRQNPAVTVANSVAETELWNFVIPAGMLVTQGRIRATQYGQINSILPGAVLTLRFNWLGVSVVTTIDIVGGATTLRTNVRFRNVFELFMNGAQNSWRASLMGVMSVVEAEGGNDHPGWNVSNGPICAMEDNANGATDMSSARTLQATAQWDSASASNSLTLYHNLVELLP